MIDRTQKRSRKQVQRPWIHMSIADYLPMEQLLTTEKETEETGEKNKYRTNRATGKERTRELSQGTAISEVHHQPGIDLVDQFEAVAASQELIARPKRMQFVVVAKDKDSAVVRKLIQTILVT